MKGTRRIVILALAMLLVFAFAIGASSKKGGKGSAAAKGDVTQGMDRKLKMAMIVHDTTSAFQAFFKEGGEDCAKAHNIDFAFMGTTSIDIPKQVAMFENAVQGGFDAIAVTIFDQKAFEKGINDAKAKGIAVLSFNIDGDWGKRATLGYSGSNMYKQGYDFGKYFFGEVMKGKGKYIFLPAIADLGVLIDRMNGMKDAAKAYPDIKYITTVEIGTDLTKAYTNTENAYTAHPDVTAFIGTDFFCEGMGQFISKKGLNGKVLGGAFDVTPGMLKYLKENALQGITQQNPYLQGYYAIEQAWIYLAKGYDPVELDTGATIVTQKNMGPYLKYYNME
jgi:ABC-type sugar transport system substrate-binding protein